MKLVNAIEFIHDASLIFGVSKRVDLAAVLRQLSRLGAGYRLDEKRRLWQKFSVNAGWCSDVATMSIGLIAPAQSEQ